MLVLFSSSLVFQKVKINHPTKVGNSGSAGDYSVKTLEHDSPLSVIHCIHEGAHDQKPVLFVTL